MPDPRDPEIVELERQMAEMTGGDVSPMSPEAEPSVEAEAPAAEEVAAEPIEQESIADETPEREPEIDWRAEAEKLRATLTEREKHAARLAGEVGYLKSRLKGAPPAGDATSEPEAENSDDYGGGVDPVIANELETLRYQREEDQKRIERLENEYDSKLHERAMQDAMNPIEHALGGLRPEDQPAIQAAVTKHADLIEDLKHQHDPELVQAGARYLAQSVGADILAGRNQRMVERKASTAAANHRAKQSGFVSGSGGVPTPPPRQRTPGDMTAAEADAWLRENVR